MQSSFVVVRTNRGARGEHPDIFSSRGPQFVSSFLMTLRLLKCLITA
jgi:hypothetical protein